MKNPHSKSCLSKRLHFRSAFLVMIVCTLCCVQPRTTLALNCAEVGYDFIEDNCCFDFWKDLTSSDVGAIRVSVIVPSFVLSASGYIGWTAAVTGNVITFTPSSAPTAPGAAQIGRFCITPNGANPVFFTIEYLDFNTGTWQCMQTQQIKC